jgi:DNA modification methylase
MQINWTTVQKKVDDLLPADYNPRQMTEDQANQLEKSLKKFGLAEIPAVNVDGTILAGHQRMAMLKKLGKGGELIDVRIPNRQLTDEEAKEYNLRSNKNTGEWDFDKLLSMDEELLKDVGFDEAFFDNLLNKDDKTAEEDDFEQPDTEILKTDIKLGDIIEIGEHRLMCGDSTSEEQVLKLMDGQKADMVFTSPPYNANTKTGHGDIFNKKGTIKLYGNGYSDNLESDKYIEIVKKVLDNCFLYTDGFIFWNVSYNANSRYEYIRQINNHLEYLIEQICWKKCSTIPFKGSLMREWEPIYLFSTNGETLGLDNVVGNHWEISNTHSQQDNHKACFPVALPFKAIELVKKCNLVLEPFCGSGSTMVAAHQLGRKCYGMELDPKYCQVIVNRMRALDDTLTVKINGSVV